MALGNDAKATADNATAVGAGNHDSTGALASASGASAFGYLAKAQGSNSTAVGANSLATAANTIAIGGDSTASGAQAIAIGNLSVANSVNSIALGNGAQQIYSGGLNTATSNSIAIGHLATNGNRSSNGTEGFQGSQIAIGTEATTVTDGQIAIGYKANPGQNDLPSS